MANKKISFSQLIKKVRFVQLYRVLQGLKGKKCWKAGFTYGGEMHLHFGARIPYRNPSMAGESKGTWILGSCGTPWHLVAPDGSITSEDHDEAELSLDLRQLEGATVVDIGLSLPDGTLTLFFTKKRRLQVVPSARDRRYQIPYWELSMPNHRLVAFGPGNRWSSRRSDVTPPHESPASRRVRPSALTARTSGACVS